MRPIARQSARLGRLCEAGSRHVAAKHSRGFTWTAGRSLDSRGPNGQPDHDTRIDSRRNKDEHRSRDDEVAKPAAESDSKVAETQAGNSNEARTAGGNVTIRQRRKDIEEKKTKLRPPPIPSWFLDHNVKLQVDGEAPDRTAKNAQVLRCVDRDTGHTLFLLPWYEAWPVPGTRPTPKLDADGTTPRARKKHIDQAFFDNKFVSQSATPAPRKPRTEQILSPPRQDTLEDSAPHALLRWALLEAETGIRAGFTAAAHAQSRSSYAASKVDISLLSDPDTHEQMDDVVEDLAALSQADVIRLDANDFSDLTAEFVGEGSDLPGSFAALGYDVFDGFTSTSNRAARLMEEEEEEEEDEMEDGEEDEDDAHHPGGINAGPFGDMRKRYTTLFDHIDQNRHRLDKALGKISVTGISFGPSGITKMGSSSFGQQNRTMDSASSYDSQQVDGPRLAALLDGLLDAPKAKRSSTATPRPGNFRPRLSQLMAKDSTTADSTLSAADLEERALWRSWRSNPGFWLPDVAGLLAGRVASAKDLSLGMEVHQDQLKAVSTVPTRTIVHVRDLKEICNSRIGEAIVRKLVRVVQKRRKRGEEILVVGTTAQDTYGGSFATFAQDIDDLPFRTVNVPAFFNMASAEQDSFKLELAKIEPNKNPTHHKVLEINSRHLESMFKRLRPGDHLDLFTETSQRQLQLAASQILSQKVLSLDNVQRLLLTAIGLSQVHAQAEAVNASHIGLATLITEQGDRLARAWSKYNLSKDPNWIDRHKPFAEIAAEMKAKQEARSPAEKAKTRIDDLARNCNPHESRLLTGVVDPQNIKTGFQEVHAPPETIESLKTMTSLSLQRPEAFKYGVLAADRLPGLMLYGPPGTGKTLLARAVAKESKATVLEVSGAQIYEKYVGEGEKMVRAVFSLAKKLSPCIVFIDEADAIFGSRSNAGNKTTHREIINQFLREWDGMEMANVFIMVASNRPFDLDDAVLRRLPRRILVDLPVAKDRESILKIHLKDEALDETVKLADLADQTPLYSGSDLKNLCVSAALACVREENDLMASKQDDKDFKLPEKRTLSGRHFEKAIKEISASISEDMSSLTAIRKFDEQYGDRRGRRKKAAYGFGMGDMSVDESAARVRPP